MKNILITGGAGFIGSHVVRLFLNKYPDYNIYNLDKLILQLKIVYEDFWKEKNLINTSIKLPISVQMDSKNYKLSLKFEETLNEIDLIGSFTISSYDKNFIFYELIFNGTPKNFINIMKEKNFNFDTQNKIWILQ